MLNEANQSAPPDGDPTLHAEVVTTAAAWHLSGTDWMNQRPCTPARAVRDVRGHGYWTGIGRIVYGLPEHRLLEFTGDYPENPTFALPCREVLATDSVRLWCSAHCSKMKQQNLDEGYWH